MKVTPEAQAALQEVFAANNADGLLVEIRETCCGKSPAFGVAVFDENDQPEVIDGISFVIPEGTREAIDDLVIDLINGELVVLNAVCGCGEGGCASGGCHHE